MIPTLDTAPDLRESVRLAGRNRRIALGLTRAELAARPGVPPATLKRFERPGEVSLSSLLALAEALDALEGFQGPFPLPEARTLDEFEVPAILAQQISEATDMARRW